MEHVLDQALVILSKGEAQALIIAGILDFILRLIPSQKPLGVMYLIADGAKKVGEILVKLGGLLDKILPQRLK